MSATVVLYGRPGCHLCDDARDLLVQAQERLGFTLRERDIEQDDRLLAAYLERIPVVTIDGAEVFEFFVDEARLERALATPRLSERHQ
jgi:glutaredoxin